MSRLLQQLDELEKVIKHLPGRHDQRRHGWRYSAVSASTLEYWDALSKRMGLGEFHEYSKRWQSKYEKGAFEPKLTELEQTIARRKALGHDLKLDAESQKYWDMAMDDIKPLDLKDNINDIKPVTASWTHDRHMRGYFITANDRLAEVSDEFSGGTNDHVGFMALSSEPEAFGLTDKEANNLLAAYMDMSLGLAEGGTDAMGSAWEKAFKSGVIRVREFGDDVAIESDRIDNSTLKRLQRLYDQNKFAVNWNGNVTWESQDYNDYDYITVKPEKLMGASSVGQLKR